MPCLSFSKRFMRFKQVANNYRIDNLIAEGGFGEVFAATNKETREQVALKVNFGKIKRSKYPLNEVSILMSIQKDNPNDQTYCLKMMDFFVLNNHLAMVTELLSSDLYRFLYLGSYRPLHISNIKIISKQLITALSFLHRSGITHCDIKPENILLFDASYEIYDTDEGRVRMMNRPEIRLADFGSAFFDGVIMENVVCTRSYRPPEMLLGIGCENPVDVWMAGCTLFELYSRKMPFPPIDSANHLDLIARFLAVPEKRFRLRGDALFDDCKRMYSYRRHDNEEHRNFFDLLKLMLNHISLFRIRADDALNHIFFK